VGYTLEQKLEVIKRVEVWTRKLLVWAVWGVFMPEDSALFEPVVGIVGHVKNDRSRALLKVTVIPFKALRRLRQSARCQRWLIRHRQWLGQINARSRWTPNPVTKLSQSPHQWTKFGTPSHGNNTTLHWFEARRAAQCSWVGLTPLHNKHHFLTCWVPFKNNLSLSVAFKLLDELLFFLKFKELQVHLFTFCFFY